MEELEVSILEEEDVAEGEEEEEEGEENDAS